MKKEFSVKGLQFQFRNAQDNKDGYFEYIDVANPGGVRRLPFCLNSEKSEFKFHDMRFVEAENSAATDEYIEIVQAAIDASIVEGAVITGLRFYYRSSKKTKASSLRLYIDRHDGTQYHFVADRSSFSKYLSKDGVVSVPTRKRPEEVRAPVAAPETVSKLLDRFGGKDNRQQRQSASA